MEDPFKEYAYSNPLLLSVTSLSPPFTVFWVKGPQGPLTPPIPPNFQYPPHPCIHTCPTTPPPILKHGNVFIGNRIFPSMPCFPALALAAFNTKLVFGCQRPLGRCHQLSKHLSEILQTIFSRIASNMSVEMMIFGPESRPASIQVLVARSVSLIALGQRQACPP